MLGLPMLLPSEKAQARRIRQLQNQTGLLNLLVILNKLRQDSLRSFESEFRPNSVGFNWLDQTTNILSVANMRFF